MVKINYKKNIKSQIIKMMMKIKQAYYLDDSRKICIIEGELKNKEIINWFLELDPEVEISFADDFDKDLVVLSILNEAKRTISHIPEQKKIDFISDMQEFENCNLTSEEEFIKYVVETIFGEYRLFKRMGFILKSVITVEGYSVNELTSDEYYAIEKHVERFCRLHNYKKIKVANFFKMLKIFWEWNKE